MHEIGVHPKEFWILLAGVIIGVIGKVLSLEKVSYRILVSKVLFAVSLTVALWHFGVFHHWDVNQIISYGIFTSWGIVEGTAWTIKLLLDVLAKLAAIGNGKV